MISDFPHLDMCPNSNPIIDKVPSPYTCMILDNLSPYVLILLTRLTKWDILHIRKKREKKANDFMKFIHLYSTSFQFTFPEKDHKKAKKKRKKAVIYYATFKFPIQSINIGEREKFYDDLQSTREMFG